LVLEGMMAETLALHGMVTSVPFPRLKQLVEDYERRLILAALARTRGNQRRAAAELGCLPTTLNEKMRRLGLRACDQEREADGVEGAELVGNA
jgi:DNA-binding NtrC family response regulator